MLDLTKNNVAIIPARGGSKRIPNKNIIDFMGKPMIYWTIRAALKSEVFNDVIVSTDDPAIAEISREFGASVPFLRDSFEDDKSPASLAIIYTLEKLEKQGKKFDNVSCLMPSCPLRNFQNIIDAYENFIENDIQYQLSSFKYGFMNCWWAHKISDRWTATPLFTNEIKQRSQDLETLYCPSGAIWLAKVESLMKANTFYGENYSFFPIDWKQGIDIDNVEDLELAKILFQVIENTKTL